MKPGKTATILKELRIYTKLTLDCIYDILKANTKEERKQVRGILSSLKKRGFVTNPTIGVWEIVVV